MAGLRISQLAAAAALFWGLSSGYHMAQIKRGTSEIKNTYDYVIIGGGTSGLTIADRLTEDPKISVLVVELGYLADLPCVLMPSKGTVLTVCPQFTYNITTAPQPELNNATIARWGVGAVVGGCSAINGMFFARGNKADYDLWAEFGNPGWNWDGLFPYFKKGIQFQPPAPWAEEKWKFTWDASAYGNGPIIATYAPFQWQGNRVMWNAWDDLGISGPKEGASGNAIGRFWVPSSQSATNQSRSYARTGHYDPVKQRPNYHLLVGHKADTLILSSSGPLEAKGAVIHDRNNPADTFSVLAKREVIVSGGATHTPQFLQRSGIGPAALLKKAGIPVKLDLPGVGQNLQDHSAISVGCNFTKDFSPNPSWLNTNATFAAESLEEYNKNRTGPYSLAFNSVVAFLPLKTVYNKWSSFVEKIKAQSPTDFLLPGTHPTVVKGYAKQKQLLERLYASDNIPSFQTSHGGSCSRGIANLKPLSRGSININISDPNGEPIVDFRTLSNPLDLETNIAFIRFSRVYNAAKTLAPLAPVELTPGSNITSDQDIGLYIRKTMIASTFHPIGTAAMMPLELGGVVGPDLFVHGVRNLRVVDASIMPLIPSVHLAQTVYAVAEKAADIIKARKW